MSDKYRILERLGAGGQAEVYRGVAESMAGFKKAVAIKRVLPSLTRNEKFVAMFLDEARLSLFLQHANIVQVFDISKAPDGAYFLVMEYIDGCDLKQLIDRHKERGQRIDVAHVIYIVGECCKALNYAHHLDHPETGEPLHVVHRDVSPPNILVSKQGEVKVVDFGLAKANSQVESTDPGVVKGKFAYLSPEAAMGLEVDHRADVFALGIILWEMFTGARLFYAESPYQSVSLVREARVPSITAINPRVDGELEGIVRKALARRADDRYPTAGDLGDALAGYLFSRALKVTSRDIADLVKDTRRAVEREKAGSPKESLIDALISDELARLTSLVDASAPAQPRAADPTGELIDTTNWAADLGLDAGDDDK